MEQVNSGWTVVDRKGRAALKKTERARTKKRIQAEIDYQKALSKPIRMRPNAPSIEATHAAFREYWAPIIAAIPKLPDDKMAFLTQQIQLAGFRPAPGPKDCVLEGIRADYSVLEDSVVAVDFCWMLSSMRLFCFRGDDNRLHLITFDNEYDSCLGEMEEGVQWLVEKFGGDEE